MPSSVCVSSVSAACSGSAVASGRAVSLGCTVGFLSLAPFTAKPMPSTTKIAAARIIHFFISFSS